MKKYILIIFIVNVKIIFIPFLILIIIYINKYYKYYFFCQDCIFMKIIDSECSKCTNDILFSSIKVKSVDETLDEIIKNNKSIARFGDGEFDIIFGIDRRFQPFNESLKKKLLKVLNSHNRNLLVGIMRLKNISNPFWINYMKKNKFKLGKVINKHKIYYSSMITRFYGPNISKIKLRNYVNKVKSIWNNRNILIIEGEKTRLGVGNDLFNNSKSIKRIICPSENAFKVYEIIIDYIKNLKLELKTLILISLGQTATALTYDLSKFGYQIIDFGHFDIQYEFFLRNATKPIIIPNKYVNEVAGGAKNISSVQDKNYYNEIIFHYT